MKHYPFAPLESLVMRQLSPRARDHGLRHHAVQYADPGPAAVAERLGVHRRTVHRWRECGLNRYSADEAACAAGFHPANVWPDWLDDSIQDTEMLGERLSA